MVDQADVERRFRELYTSNYGVVLVTCRRRLGELPAAEDATAEVFRIAWQKLQQGREVDLPWLYRTATNVVGNEYRRRQRQRALVDKASAHPSDDADAADATGESDDELEVKRALGRLKASDRELLFMAYWEDLAVGEMAAILRLTESAVRTRLSRARALLRKELGDGPDEALEEVTSFG